jgi:hypothetical protein
VLGNLGSTATLTLTSNSTQTTGTLTADCALTVSGLTAGCSVVLLFTQDGTGGRTLTVNGGAVTIPTGASVAFDVLMWSPDGSTLYVQPGPQTGATGATGTRGSDWFTYSGGGTPTGITGMAAGDYCLRSDGEVFTYSGSAWTDTGINIKGATGAGGSSGPNPRLLMWGIQGEPYPAAAISSSTTVLTSARAEGALVDLYAGQVITGVIVPLDAYSASLTHQWVGLCNSAGLVLVASTDSPTLLNSGVAAGLAQMIELPFSNTYTVPTTGGYYAFYLGVQTSGTMPTFYRGNAVGVYNALSGGNAGTGVPLFGFQTGISALPTVGSGSFTFAKESTPYYIGGY